MEAKEQERSDICGYLYVQLYLPSAKVRWGLIVELESPLLFSLSLLLFPHRPLDVLTPQQLIPFARLNAHSLFN